MTIESILDKLIIDIENSVIHSMQQANRVATGKTIEALQTIVTEKNAQLLAPRSIDALEYGRKPTAPNAPTGSPSVYECIQEWAQARNIAEFQVNDKGEEVNVWRAITAHIHKYGFEGTPGILTGPLSDDSLSQLLDPACDQMATMVGQEAASLFDILEQI